MCIIGIKPLVGTFGRKAPTSQIPPILCLPEAYYQLFVLAKRFIQLESQ